MQPVRSVPSNVSSQTSFSCWMWEPVVDPTLADDPRFRNHAERPMVKGARRGVFFCAVVGGRTYLRFVSADETWAVSTAEDAVVREVGTCLRLIECEPDTPTWYPEALQDRVYDFWEAAQQDIWSDWMRETGPRQPAATGAAAKPPRRRVHPHQPADRHARCPGDTVAGYSGISLASPRRDHAP